MAQEFDKEMDILLRNAAQQTDFVSEIIGENASVAHLDADTIAAFAENALPATARMNSIAHLADCGDCRSILSNFAIVSEDEETAVEIEKIVVVEKAEKISWFESFKKLFAVPTLGYATAFVLLMLVGAFAFVALRNSQNRDLAMVANLQPQTVETPKKSTAARPPRRDDEPEEAAAVVAPTQETDNANTATIAADATPTPADVADADLPPSYKATTGKNSVNRNTAAPETVARAESNNSSTANTVAPSAGASVATKPVETEAKDKKADDRLAAAEKSSTADESRAADALPAITDLTINSRAKTAAAPAPAARASQSQVGTFGGRNFRKNGGVWIDAAYNGQSLMTISRGSNEFKKLDAGLRTLAGQIGGEAIIVWNGKAYRIK